MQGFAQRVYVDHGDCEGTTPSLYSRPVCNVSISLVEPQPSSNRKSPRLRSFQLKAFAGHPGDSAPTSHGNHTHRESHTRCIPCDLG